MRKEDEMNSRTQGRRKLLYLAASALAVGFAGAIPSRGATDTVTTTVTAVTKKGSPPAIRNQDVQLYKGKERVQISDRRQSDNLFVAILIDDSLDSEAASQWNDLKAFINAQPPSAYVAVAYARNGAAMVAQDFTQNHALAAKALRIPLGGQAAFNSPYLAVQDWLKRWPASGGERRSLVLISSGIDYFRGNFDPIDPDLESTIERAQKENVNVWTIYYPTGRRFNRFGRGSFRVFNAQTNLTRLSAETGAESYYLGTERPVSLKSYFDEIQEHLNNQYLLTFQSSGGGKKGKFERVRVTSEIHNVEFLTPSEVFLPPSQ
jgi:VWFA-related protein